MTAIEVRHLAKRFGGGIAFISERDLAVLAAWAAAGVIASVCFFRWDPVRPRHAHAPGNHGGRA